MTGHATTTQERAPRRTTVAVALAICSEADAFVAASLTQFSLGARLTFLVVGPMVEGVGRQHRRPPRRRPAPGATPPPATSA